jgi:hypothetical protein
VSSPAPSQPSSGGKSSAELRAEVEEARTRLASTVGELGGAIDETRARLVARARQVAPIVGGLVVTYVGVKMLRRFGGRRDDD